MTRLITEAIRIETAVAEGIHFDNRGQKVGIISINRKEEHFTSIKRKQD